MQRVDLGLLFLKDELQTTTRSYEGQLSMMSDHLAGMNEKIAKQKEELEMLTWTMNNKVQLGKFFSIRYCYDNFHRAIFS